MNKSFDSKSFTQTSITIDGKTYSSIDEVPEEHKKQIQDMMNFDFSGEDVTKYSVQHSSGNLGNLGDLSPQAKEFINKHNLSAFKAMFAENAPFDGSNYNIRHVNQPPDSADDEQEPVYSESTNVTRGKTSIDRASRNSAEKGETAPNTNYQYGSAVQKQNTSYGWVSVVVIVGIIAAVVWKFFNQFYLMTRFGTARDCTLAVDLSYTAPFFKKKKTTLKGIVKCSQQ